MQSKRTKIINKIPKKGEKQQKYRVMKRVRVMYKEDRKGFSISNIESAYIYSELEGKYIKSSIDEAVKTISDNALTGVKVTGGELFR